MSDISRLPASPVSNTPQASGTQKATIPETITPDLQAPVSPELPKTNDFFEADAQGNWFDNFPQAAPNACMGEPAYIEVKPKTSAKLEALEKERATLQSLAEANPLHPANTKKLVDIGKARENANEAISRLRPPEEGAWYENNFITRANASVGRAVLGFANDTVLGLAQMVQESAHKIIPGVNVYSTGVEAAQQLNEYRIQQENLRLGNTTQEEISAQGKQQLSAMWDGLVEPITKPWNRGDYLEAVARGGLEVGSLLVGVGEATAATKGARAANATNKTAMATRAAETANVVNKGAEAANIAKSAETANVVKQTAKGAEGAGAKGAIGAGKVKMPEPPKPGSLDNVTSRQWYLDAEAKIPTLIDRTKPLDQQAKQAFEMRNQFRTQARDAMSDRATAESLMKTDPNMSWEQVVDKYAKKGFSGDSLWQEIIHASKRSRTNVNKSLGLD